MSRINSFFSIKTSLLFIVEILFVMSICQSGGYLTGKPFHRFINDGWFGDQNIVIARPEFCKHSLAGSTKLPFNSIPDDSLADFFGNGKADLNGRGVIFCITNDEVTVFYRLGFLIGSFEIIPLAQPIFFF